MGPMHGPEPGISHISLNSARPLTLSPFPGSTKRLTEPANICSGCMTAISSNPCSFPTRQGARSACPARSGARSGCKFCLTGSLGFKRNLDTAEIVDQVCQALRDPALGPE